MTKSAFFPNWADAPAGWNWLAQDADGRWFWYGTRPQPGVGGGVWRSPSRLQQFAGQGEVNADWLHTLQERAD